MQRRTLLQGLAAAVAWPLAARAQQSGRMPTVGYLWHAGSEKEESPYFEAMNQGFAKLGYVEGRNIRLIHRFSDEKPERFKAMAAELVAMNPDVLMGGAIAAAYLQAATATIPIVFNFVPDPVGMKMVESFAHPGGNMTGLSNFGRDIAGKRLELLKQIVPRLNHVGMLINSNQQSAAMYVEVTRSAADELGVAIETFDARAREELEPALDAMVKARMQAMIAVQGGTSFQWRHDIPRLALERRLAMCAYSRETFEDGALMSYGPDQIEMCYRSAVFADKIIKGTKLVDLPVEQPSKFEFLLNRRTAKALGIEIPTSPLLLANEVVE